jgi:hypothetical protein
MSTKATLHTLVEDTEVLLMHSLNCSLLDRLFSYFSFLIRLPSCFCEPKSFLLRVLEMGVRIQGLGSRVMG